MIIFIIEVPNFGQHLARVTFKKAIWPASSRKSITIYSEDPEAITKDILIPDQQFTGFRITGNSGNLSDDLTSPIIDFDPSLLPNPRQRTVVVMQGDISDEDTGQHDAFFLPIIGNADLILPGELKISFININPTDDDLPSEEIRIINNSNRTIDLNGCIITHIVFRHGHFEREETYFEFTDTLLLPPVDLNNINVCRVYTRERNPGETTGSFVRFANWSGPKWNNTGDTARLYNPPDFSPDINELRGALIDSVTYGSGESIFQLPLIISPPVITSIPGTIIPIIINPPEPTPTPTRLTVSVTVPWANSMPWNGTGNFIDTGLLVKENDMLDFTASGNVWEGFLAIPENDPNGSTAASPKLITNTADIRWPYRSPASGPADAFPYCLIAKIGVSGLPFLVGSSCFKVVKTSTPVGGLPLFLAINDERPFLTPPPPRLLGHGAFSCSITLTSPVPPRQKSWAIILCHLSDRPPLPGSNQRYVDFFTRAGTGPGGGGMFDYWNDMSYGIESQKESTIFGWFDLGHTTSELMAFVGPPQRQAAFDWGISAALAHAVKLNDYPRKMVILNGGGNDHAMAIGGVLLNYADSTNLEPMFIAHEMGHGYGLDHSFGENLTACATGDGRPGAYCDMFDIMSGLNVHTYQDNLNRKTGPSLNAISRERLGWLKPAFICDLGTNVPSSLSITLDPVNTRNPNNYQLLKFMAPSRDPSATALSTYTFEFREPTGWDTGFIHPHVIIHEIRSSDNLVRLITNNPGGGHLDMAPNMEFNPPNSTISVKMHGFNLSNHTVSLSITS